MKSRKCAGTLTFSEIKVARIALTLTLGLFAAFSVSGCAGIKVLNTAQAFDDVRDEVSDLPDTATMPTSGTATYRGQAALAADYGPGEDNYVLLGDTTVNATFTGAGGTMSGTMEDFVRVKLSDSEVDDYNDGKINKAAVLFSSVNARGTVDLTGGVITGNRFVMDTDGTLTARGETIDVSGQIDGRFAGTGAKAIEAGDSPSFNIAVDGKDADISDMELYATR